MGASTDLAVGLQEETQKAIPAWLVLLQVYGGFLLPIVLAILVGANMLMWEQHRINYVFIFGKAAVELSVLFFLTRFVVANLPQSSTCGKQSTLANTSSYLHSYSLHCPAVRCSLLAASAVSVRLPGH